MDVVVGIGCVRVVKRKRKKSPSFLVEVVGQIVLETITRSGVSVPAVVWWIPQEIKNTKRKKNKLFYFLFNSFYSF